MVLGIACALGAAVIYGVASIFQAVGSRQVEASRGFDPLLLVALLRRPAFVASLVLMMIGFLLHLVALRTLPLYLAQSAIAASLAVTAVLSVTVYGEKLSRREWGCVGAVVAGLALLTASGGDAGDAPADRADEIALVITILLIVVAAMAAARVYSRASTAVLGVLAGLGYAVVGVSGRLLPDIGPDLITSPITYTLGFGGLLAFLLYSQALQRGSVTTVTGPLIAVQTAAPALIGVILLGDQVREGLAVVAVVGFALAAYGTLSLVRFEQVDEGPPADPDGFRPGSAEPQAPGTPSPRSPGRPE